MRIGSRSLQVCLLVALAVSSFFLVSSGGLNPTPVRADGDISVAAFSSWGGHDFVEDAAGKLHLVLVDNGFIKYAYSTDGGNGWTSSTINVPQDGQVIGPTLTVDQSGAVFIFYYSTPAPQIDGRQWEYSTYVVSNISGSWVVETLQTNASYVGNGHDSDGGATNNGIRTIKAFTDSANQVHFLGAHYGWYGYGGSIWEFVRGAGPSGTWAPKVLASHIHNSSVDIGTTYHENAAIGPSDKLTVFSHSDQADNIYHVDKTAGAWGGPATVAAVSTDFYQPVIMAYDGSGQLHSVFPGTDGQSILHKTDWGASETIFTVPAGYKLWYGDLHAYGSGGLKLVYVLRETATDKYGQVLMRAKPSGGAWSDAIPLTQFGAGHDEVGPRLARTNVLGKSNTYRMVYADLTIRNPNGGQLYFSNDVLSTPVGGLITSNTTWTAARSPYIITSSILVNAGARLTIEPGVMVKFNSGKGMQIDGELVARGTEANPILFTSNQAAPAPGDWVNLMFSDSSMDAGWDGINFGSYTGGSILEYVTVEYGGASNTPAVKIVSSSPLIDRSTVRNNGSSGIWVENGSPTIGNSMLSGNSAGYAGGGVYVQSGTVTLSGNTISGNSAGNNGGGLYAQGGTVTLVGNAITGNSAGWGGGGMSFGGGTVNASDNSISGNSAGIHGGAIAFHSNMSYVTLTHNRINGNLGPDGIYLIWQPAINNNEIHDNGTYDLYNANPQGSPVVNAANNWWGTASESEIQSRIFDWFDDASKGIVNYSPFLTSSPFGPSGAISGHVYEADGVTPIGGAEIDIIDFNTREALTEVFADTNGSYTVTGVPDGSYAVYAWAPGHVLRWWQDTLLRPQATAVVIAGGNAAISIDFSLEPGGTISGNITSQATGLPLADISVDVSRVDGVSGSRRNTSDQSGNYIMFGLPFGQYKVGSPGSARFGAGDGSYVREFYNNKSDLNSADIVTISAAAPDAAGVNFALARGGTISGHVTDESGNALAGAHVWADFWTGGTFGSADTDAQGNYTIADVPGGDYRVQAYASGRVKKYYNSTFDYNSASRVYVTPPSATSGISFSLESGGSISGTITSQTTGLSLANVSVNAKRADGPGSGGATTDSNGNYTINYLPLGSYKVSAPSSKRNGAGDDGFIVSYYNVKADFNSADPVTISSESPTASGVNIALTQGGSINGQVTDESGNALASAHVWADLWTGGTVGSADTDAQGNYTIAGVPGGDYRVQAQANGRVKKYYSNTFDYNSASQVHVTPPDATSNIDFSLEPGGSISGTITSQTTGLSLANVSVNAKRADGPGSGGATTDSNGNYTINYLPLGSYKVSAPSSKRNGAGDDGFIVSYYNGKSDFNSADPVTISAGYPTASGVNIALLQGGSISGHVYGADGVTPLSGASIGIQDFNTNAGFSGVGTQADGSYTIPGLPAGSYRISAWVTGHERRWWQNTVWSHEATPVVVLVPNNTPNINFSLPNGGTITGTITSQATGLPLANVSVDAGRTDGAGAAGATTNSSGVFTITGLPLGQYKVSSPSSKRWGSGDNGHVTEYYNDRSSSSMADMVTLAVATPDATGVNFALAQGGAISGRLTDDLGNPIANADVWADYWVGGSYAGNFGGAKTDSQGNYSIIGMPSGDYRVQAQATGKVHKAYDNTFDYNAPTVVHVTAPNATSNINFSLEPGGSISGTVTAQATGLPLANINVSAKRTDGAGEGGANTDSNGNYTIGYLPFGQYKVNAPTGKGSGDDGYVTSYYSGKPDLNSADPVTLAIGSANATGVNFSLVQGGFISGTVLDEATGLPVVDASYGSIDLSVGWHKLVYRFEEREGASDARAAFKAPGDAAWRWFSTTELEIRASADHGATSGINLVTRRNNSSHPVNHSRLVLAVDVNSTPDPGWYGESIVSAINQNENIHGNDDYFVSHYEAYFYVSSADTWWFSTDSDDASEIEIDDQVVAYWYNGHQSAGRWEHKAMVTVYDFATGAHVQGKVTAADGTYRIGPFPPGSYRVQATSPGYGTEFYQESATSAGATSVVVASASDRTGVNFTMNRLTGSISGTVSYSGTATDNHNIFVLASSIGAGVYDAMMPGLSGAYDIPAVADGAYFVYAVLDLDDNGVRSAGDPIGFYYEPVIVSGGAVSYVDINIDDTPQGVAVGTLKLQGQQGIAEGARQDVWISADDGQNSFNVVPFPDGMFIIAGPVSTYDVAVEMQGYLPAARSGVVLTDITLLGPVQHAPELPPLILFGGDADFNYQVDIADLVMVAANFGANTTPGYDGDVNSDGVVNIADLVLVGINFGNTASPWP